MSSSLGEKIERAGVSGPEHPWVGVLVSLFADRTTICATLRPSFALYVVLLFLAHKKTGRVLVTKDSLAELFGVTSPTLDGWLVDLEQSQLVRVLSRGEYLVLVIEKWRNERPKESAPPSEIPSKTMPQNPPSIPPPSSALFRSAQNNSFESARRILQSKAEAKQKPGDGVEGVGGGEEAARERFLSHIVEALGPMSDAEALRTFCHSYPQEILEAALDRVEKTPLEKIKKSRGALFVHLVKTYGKPTAHP